MATAFLSSFSWFQTEIVGHPHRSVYSVCTNFRDEKNLSIYPVWNYLHENISFFVKLGRVRILVRLSLALPSRILPKRKGDGLIYIGREENIRVVSDCTLHPFSGDQMCDSQQSGWTEVQTSLISCLNFISCGHWQSGVMTFMSLGWISSLSSKFHITWQQLSG